MGNVHREKTNMSGIKFGPNCDYGFNEQYYCYNNYHRMKYLSHGIVKRYLITYII